MNPLHNARRHKAVSRAREQDGVTMIIAMGVMLVTSLLLTASFLAARGDINLSHTDTTQKEAYYAAVAGVQEFEYQMQVNPYYW
jgi:Tfp pilus assembly protein PilX